MGGAQLFKTWLFSEPMISRHSFMPSHIVIATLCVDPTITSILEMKEAWFREVRNFTCITQVADRKSCTLSKENLLSSYTQIFVLCIPKEINIKQAFLLEIRSRNNKTARTWILKLHKDRHWFRSAEKVWIIKRNKKAHLTSHLLLRTVLSTEWQGDMC